jgi:hypothetical protein
VGETLKRAAAAGAGAKRKAEEAGWEKIYCAQNYKWKKNAEK